MMKDDNKKLASAAMLGPDAYETDTEDISKMIKSAAKKAELVPGFEGLVGLAPIPAERLRDDTEKDMKREGIGTLSDRWEEPFYVVPRVL